MTGRNQTSNPQPKGVRDCNLCSLRKAVSEGGRRAAAKGRFLVLLWLSVAPFLIDSARHANGEAIVPRPMSLWRAHDAESAAIPHERHAGIIILYYVVLIVFQKKNANCSLQKDMETELKRISLKHGDRNADCLP